MTGTAPAANGMVGFEYSDWDPQYTLAGELAKGGYETRLVGKLHLQPRRKRFGFDHMSLADGIGGETDYTAWLRAQPVRRLPILGGTTEFGANIGRPGRTPCLSGESMPTGVPPRRSAT